MKRRYETTIEIKPFIGNVGFESGTDSGDDIDSIQSEFYESALEQVERNFCDFDPVKINVTVPASIQSMFFEKKSFFYWLEDGIIELSVESRQPGKWKTLDNNISAQGLFMFWWIYFEKTYF